jgi:LuxR family maltose regulon positive regulatory protein
MLDAYPALLITKLYLPRARSSHIARPDLLARLNAALERKLIVIAAAAGFGKTSLVAAWAAQQPDRFCWLSLDDGDNDPARFLSYLIAAIQTRRPQLGVELLAALQSPQPPPSEHALSALINQLAAAPGRLAIVLDDYHVIHHTAIHAALAFLLDHLPPDITLVLLSRIDPPLSLAKLRARDDLLEVRAAELRFSLAEADQFFNATLGLQLPSDAVRALDDRTEGWIAGLQLAAVALQRPAVNRQAFLQDFTGSHRFVLDYLIEEVLSQQSAPVRRFLLCTSILHRLNAALCSAVADDDGQARLDYLEQHQLFLVPLDDARQWYRYHHLFADLLRARLQAEEPDVIVQLQRRAAQWHAHNNFPEEAVIYALAARDFELAAQLIVGPASGVSQRGEVATLLDWHRAFPPDFIVQQPRLCLYFGMAFALNGRWAEAETLLNNVEQHAADERPSETLLLAYLVAAYRHDADRLTAVAQAALRQTHPEPITLVVLAFVTSLSGDLKKTCDLLAEAQAAAEQRGDLTLALTALFHRTRFHVLHGDLQQGAELSKRALERIHLLGDAARPLASFAHAALGRAYLEWNEPDPAEQHLTQMIQLAERTGFLTGNLSSGTLMLAEVKQARGDAAGAIELTLAALAYAERYDPPVEVTWLKTYQARLWLCQGNTSAASEWLKSTHETVWPPSLFYPANILPVTQARVLLAQRKFSEAISLLTQLIAAPPDLLTVEALAVLAVARQAQGDSVHAQLAVEQALTLAAPENRVRALLDLGAPLGKLLVRFGEAHPEHGFAQRLRVLLSASPQAETSIEPLSDRELEVMRLIVAGKSNEEIAQTLTIALSTVKWYVNTLYSKLHVKTRAQAIARTRELKLLID